MHFELEVLTLQDEITEHAWQRENLVRQWLCLRHDGADSAKPKVRKDLKEEKIQQNKTDS